MIKSTLDKISSVYPELNTAWRLTGVGNMINENKNNVGRDNYGVQGNGSQNISGNMVNVTMPESGTQKIIKPTGEVEIQRLAQATNQTRESSIGYNSVFRI